MRVHAKCLKVRVEFSILLVIILLVIQDENVGNKIMHNLNILIAVTKALSKIFAIGQKKLNQLL